MKTLIKITGLLSVPVLIAACGTTSLEKRVELEDKQTLALVEKVVNTAPKWYTQLPANTQKVVYVTGTGTSTSLQLARDKAILDGEKQLANQIHAMVSSRMKQYVREVGLNSPITLEDNEQVTKKLVVEANVAGYAIHKSELQPSGRNFRFYMLLEYPIGDANVLRTIVDTEKLIKKFSGDRTKAFKELDGEINAKRIDQQESLVLQTKPVPESEPLLIPLAQGPDVPFDTQ